MLNDILTYLDGQREAALSLHEKLVAIPALGPDNGGAGERDKAEFLKSYLKDLGVESFTEIDAPDPRAEDGTRPNIATVLPGKDDSRTLWIISHIDVVPPGDRGLWNSDPYELKVEGDDIVGRGVEDNHGGIVPSLLVLKALIDQNATPEINYGVLLVADEETGSRYGLDYVVKHRPDLFGQDDLFLVPDFGGPDSTMMEVAEKSMLWLKVTVLGKQCHASVPHQGVNTLVAAADLIMRIRGLYDEFVGRDDLFDPPFSTFEPTKKEANVENVNTVPGRDVFYIDCRVLPEYDIARVIGRIEELGDEIAARHGVDIEYEAVQQGQAAPATPVDAPVVLRLSKAIRKIYDVAPRPAGIGGGTVAAILRRAGHDAVVWATCAHNAHQPNERASLSAQLGDAKVMATMLFE